MFFTLITQVSDSSKMMMITTMGAMMMMMMMIDDGDEVDDEDDCGTMEDRAHTMQWPVSLANGPRQRVKH